jgi:ADP-ribosylglycohydrolase
MVDLNKIKGCLFGLSIGDAIGLRYETVKPKNIKEKNIGKSCIFGAVSDDTEQMILITKSLLETKNINEFKDNFRKKLQLWLLTLPINIGKTTLKSIMKSFISKGYGTAGTGNGSVMRIAPIGLIFKNDQEKIKEYTEVSCRITHNSDESVVNSIAIAILISYILNNNLTKDSKLNIPEILILLKNLDDSSFWQCTVRELEEAIKTNIEPIDLVKNWTGDKGAIGYTKYSTLLSIYCWIKYYGDYKKSIIEIIKCGGDSDTNAAILGSLMGVSVGYDNLPIEWLNKLNDIVVSVKDINIAASSIANNKSKIKLWKFILFGAMKNTISIIYFSLLLLKVFIFSLFSLKH